MLEKKAPLQQADIASLAFITVTVFFSLFCVFFLSRKGYWEQEDQVMETCIISVTETFEVENSKDRERDF